MYYRNIAHSSVGNNIIKAIEDYKKIADSTRTGSPLFDRLGERKEIGTPEDYRRIIPNIEEDSKYSTMFHNKKIDAGWTYFGQFITHDITIRREFGEIVPRLNLDCLYGLGQTSNGYLYDYQDNHSNHLPKGVCFALETYLKKDTNMLVYDVPRTGVERSIPLMGDIRNDDNFLLSQLHCTFLRFHNQMVEFFYHREIVDPHELFKKTRQFVTWTYQWLIINEYLKLMTGKVSHDLISGQPSKILPVDSWNSLPVLLPEFIIAALRVGHSQVRQSYRLNAIDISDLSLFSLGNNEPDLSGFKRDDRRGFIDWSFFFHFDDQKKVQKSRPMDLFLADSMNHVPLLGGQSRNMGEVNIRRSIENKLVIMQDDMKVLRELGINSLGCFETELDALYNSAYDILPVPYDRRHPPHKEFRKYWISYKKELISLSELKGWPLWVFLLLEARIKGADTFGINHVQQTLGPLGAQIFAEQIIWTLKKDPTSYLYQNPSWSPLDDLQDYYKPGCRIDSHYENRVATFFSIVDVLNIATHSPFSNLKS